MVSTEVIVPEPSVESSASGFIGRNFRRRRGHSFSFLSSLSFLIGAFIGAVAGALGGYHRDEI